MKRFSACNDRRERSQTPPAALLRRLLFVLLVTPVMACGDPNSGTPDDDPAPVYETVYRVTPYPSQAGVTVELELRQPKRLLREVRFRAPATRFTDFEGDGEIERDGDTLRWSPPKRGGKLRWKVTVTHKRNASGYDAMLGETWGLFRAEDIVPSAATRGVQGAYSDTRLVFDLPPSWSVVTEYADLEGVFLVVSETRRFKQPKGWIVMGDIGVRREQIAGVEVAVAGPVKNGVRRLDMLALLNWTLPELARVLPELPPLITIVSAADPMWRGGLSAPASLYIHADRPLLSENGTSTLLHEIMHVVLDFSKTKDHDWIVEGLAEFYSLELLRRSGTISRPRFDIAREKQKEWSRSSDRLCGSPSSGATTARAVMVFMELDREIRRKTDGRSNLDDVVSAIVSTAEDIDVDVLDRIVSGIIGENPDALHIDKLPGCRKMEQP
jgi:hypothetical protein